MKNFWQWLINLFGSKPAATQIPAPAPVPTPSQPIPAPQSDAPATGYRATVLTRWRSCKVLDSKKAHMEAIAQKAISFRSKFYDPVEKATGIPWYVVACIDMREESFNHNGYLGNGDPWNKVSVHVPKGRGPFSSWYEGAIDALRLDGLDKVKHWDIVTALIQLENFNGTGYQRAHGIASPYVWAMTSIQVAGKYTSDGKYSATTWDTQEGCAALIMTLRDNHGVDVGEA